MSNDKIRRNVFLNVNPRQFFKLVTRVTRSKATYLKNPSNQLLKDVIEKKKSIIQKDLKSKLAIKRLRIKT
jgi:hypothetical protein